MLKAIAYPAFNLDFLPKFEVLLLIAVRLLHIFLLCRSKNLFIRIGIFYTLTFISNSNLDAVSRFCSFLGFLCSGAGFNVNLVVVFVCASRSCCFSRRTIRILNCCLFADLN